MAKKNKVLNPVQIRKIFILDTSVILHDHQAVNQFEEHDVAIPISVLEELDSFKKGNDTINFEARQFIRFVDKLSEGNSLNQWIQLSPETPSCFTVVMQESGTEEQAAGMIGTVDVLRRLEPRRGATPWGALGPPTHAEESGSYLLDSISFEGLGPLIESKAIRLALEPF